MRIPLEAGNGIPLYRQVQSFLGEAILAGKLSSGTRLPASRSLAQNLGVSRITIETAYAELEAAGLVVSRAGSGTYVLPTPSLSASSMDRDLVWPLWQQDLLPPVAPSGSDPMSGELEAASHQVSISFAGGGGDPLLFPLDDFRKALLSVMRRYGTTALEYGAEAGYRPLRQTIAHVLTSQGLSTRADNILITSGSQQALSLTLQLLLRPGDVLLVESPTYARALDLFRARSLKVVGIPLDEHGMQVELLEGLLQQFHPKLIYTIPNFHNPTGISLSGHRRRQLVALADRYNVPILEDDFVGDLRYEGSAQPALKSLDPGGRVLYTSTFSKMLLPGVRVGFMVAEGPAYERLVQHKQLHDLATSNLMQHALHEYVTLGRYRSHLRRSCSIYRERRDAMLKAISRHLPSETRVTTPQGGLFLWLRLPDQVSAEELLPVAFREGVTFALGNSFFPDPANGAHHVRLNFASQSPLAIAEGIDRLGLALKKM